MVDSQKDAEKDMRSQLSAADRESVEAEIKRRKVEKEVSRLKGKVKAMFEADREDATEELDSIGGGRCDVEDSNGDDAEELPRRRSRERPSGLSYKLRHAATRAAVRRYVGRKAEQLERWLTHVISNDDSWQRVFGDSEEEAGDRSGEGEHGRVELREEEDLVGQPVEVRAAHTPRFILVALLANYPELLNAILKSKHFKHVFKGAEKRAMHAIRELWERNGLRVYTDLRLSQDAYQRLINLTTHRWDADMEEMVRLVLSRGAHMCKWPAVATMLDRQAEELSDVGLQSSADMVLTTLDLSLVLQQRARRLLKEGVIQHGEALRVQVIADASGIFNATGTNGTVVVLKV
jgi:hypothetical protein